VGLAQREIEEAGLTTVTLSNIPDLTAAVGVPRLVGIEYPFGQTVGRPGDSGTQRAVLRGALQAVDEMTIPGSIKHLPFEWPGTKEEAQARPPEPPPIVGYLKRHPWELPKLLTRSVSRRS
jgi:hypothetical protein